MRKEVRGADRRGLGHLDDRFLKQTLPNGTAATGSNRCNAGIDRTQVSVERIVSTQTTSWRLVPHEQASSPA